MTEDTLVCEDCGSTDDPNLAEYDTGVLCGECKIGRGGNPDQLS